MFYYPIDLHYSQTRALGAGRRTEFYYPIDLHYSQTFFAVFPICDTVLLPYRFTLLSNRTASVPHRQRFYYPIDLHYSQTSSVRSRTYPPFYYPIDLHYSQTGFTERCSVWQFYYPIDLHYSQTSNIKCKISDLRKCPTKTFEIKG